MNNPTNKLIPELRFPEFVNDGEWGEKSLDSITTKISDGIHATPNYSDSEDYYFINGNNLIDGKISIDEKTKKVSKEEYNKHKRDLSDSTILLSINGTIGNIAEYNGEKVILGKSACYINVDKTKVDKTFIIYYIQTASIKKYFELELTGSTIKNLSLKTIKDTIIKLPKNPREQKEIATCLSSLDELLTAHTEKLETLKTHKKGLMQNLFPQEGENVPKLRFKEFENDGNWEENKLGNIGKFSKGKGISKNDIIRNGNFECIRYGELYTTYGEVIEEVVSKTNLNKNELIFSEENDVILPSSGETQIDIAKASCILKKGIAIGGDINIFKSTVNGVFLSYYLNSVKKMEISRLSQGISVVHLYSSQLENLNINYPVSNDKSQLEQQKIAETLSSLDHLIKDQTNKIEQLKSHKKGLMQGLFPKISTN